MRVQNQYPDWTQAEIEKLRWCAAQGYTVAQTITALDRGQDSIRRMAKRLRISFRRPALCNDPERFNGPYATETLLRARSRTSVSADTPEAARAFRDALTRSLAFLEKREGRAA